MPERVLLFWAASGTDWLHAGITGDTVTVTVVDGLVERPELGRLSLTEKERAALVGLPRMAASIEGAKRRSGAHRAANSCGSGPDCRIGGPGGPDAWPVMRRFASAGIS